MKDNTDSNRTQIIIAVIGLVGTIIVALVSNIDWRSTSPPLEQAEPNSRQDSLAGFYVRDGLANSPIMKITSLGQNEYKLEVFNHPWPWVATVRLNDSNLTGYGRFPESKATMDFKGMINSDGSIKSEYHFLTKGDGTPANGRVDTHIWTPRDA